MKEIKTIEEFDVEVKKDKVLVDFYAEWCGPCKLISPVLEELEHEGKINLVKVNIDNFPELAREFGIMAIPNIRIFEKGINTKTNVGLMSKSEIEEFIK